jgi:DNA-directed RNA polymerase subunit RPC12/RpoP
MFYKCKKCGRIVWFWQSKAAATLTLKNGKKKKIRLCVDCGMLLLSGEQTDER